MHHLVGPILIGAVAGLVTGTGARELLRGVIRSGIVEKRKLQAFGATTAEQARSVVDEARADLDRPERERPS